MTVDALDGMMHGRPALPGGSLVESLIHAEPPYAPPWPAPSWKRGVWADWTPRERQGFRWIGTVTDPPGGIWR